MKVNAEAKQIDKERVKLVKRKDSRLTAFAVWTLVVIEAVRFVSENSEVFLNVVR